MEDYKRTLDIIVQRISKDYRPEYSITDIAQACYDSVNRIHPEEVEAILIKSKDGESSYCNQCGKCCRDYYIILRIEDIYKLSKVVDITGNIEKSPDHPDLFRFKTKPCKYILPDRRCSCYNQRPLTCRNHPITDGGGHRRVVRDPECEYILSFFYDKAVSLLTKEPFQ